MKHFLLFNLLLTAIQLDPETGRHTKPHPLDVSPGRTGESEINSTLSQEPSVNVESHREGQQIEEAEGNQFLNYCFVVFLLLQDFKF